MRTLLSSKCRSFLMIRRTVETIDSSLSPKPVTFTWFTIHAFVLAALCLIFAGPHIVLLDSDCVPVTLFKVEDLWRKAQRLQHSRFSGPVLTSSWAEGLNSDQLDQTALSNSKPLEVILVTEHNAEVNAGFTVLLGSNHASSLQKKDWQRILLNVGESCEFKPGSKRSWL